MGRILTGRRGVAAAAATLAALVAAPPAPAVHWPAFGGDNGRSGYQPVDEGGVPLIRSYAKTEATERFVKSSIITSAGSPAAQRVIFGTRSGFVNMQVLGSGAPVGPEAGVGVDEGAPDLDVFGTRSMVAGGNGSSVSATETSSATGLGQVFAVHNDDDVAGGAPDIEIAQLNEADGALVKQVDVAGTDGFTIQSSAVVTGPNASGDRALFFTVNDGAGDSRLFKVPIAAAGTVGAAIGAATSTPDVNATPLASPTVASLDVGGTPTPHVVVATTDGVVRSYRVDTLAAGPASADLGGDAQTVSIPVQPSGNPPSGAATEPVKAAPFLYVATREGSSTVVHKLGPDVQQIVESTPLDGTPAPALAVEQESEPDQADAKVIVTTGANLYLIDTADMGRSSRLSQTNLDPGTTGFAQTTAAASGEFIYVTNDGAVQQVLRLSDAKPVSATEFPRDPANTGETNTGVGQPSISRGFVQYSGGQGVFVYRNRDTVDPSVTLTAPTADATLSATTTFTATAFDARGIASVVFRANGQPVGTDTTPNSGGPFGAPGAAYSAQVDTTKLPDGSYLVDAVATDGSGRTRVTEQRRVFVRNVAAAPVGPDDRPPTVSFAAPASNAQLGPSTTVSLTAADDRGVAGVSLFNGTTLVCTDTTAPYSCTFTPSGADVGVATLFAVATDTTGQTGSASRSVRINRFAPRSLSARVSPSRDARSPYRFTTRGSVSLPARVTSAQGCSEGTVSVQIKAGSRTISSRRVSLSRTCSYRSAVTFRLSRRLSGRLKVTARFRGNRVLTAKSAPARFVRIG